MTTETQAHDPAQAAPRPFIAVKAFADSVLAMLDERIKTAERGTHPFNDYFGDKPEAIVAAKAQASELREVRTQVRILGDRALVELMKFKPAIPAPDPAPARFPAAIWSLLLDVADRNGKPGFGPWQNGDGEPMQDDADAAIAWIKAAAIPAPEGAEPNPAVPLSAMRAIAVEAIRAVTGCPDIRGNEGRYLVDELEAVANAAARTLAAPADRMHLAQLYNAGWSDHEAGNSYRPGEALTAWLAAPAPQAPVAQWISIYEQAPEIGQDCIVWIASSPWATAPYATTDKWDEQREDPLGMGGPTIPVGPGWDENPDAQITHWMPLPAAPQTKEPTNDR